MSTVTAPAPLPSVAHRLDIARARRLAASHPRAVQLAAYVLVAFAVFASTWVAPFTHLVGGAGGDQAGFLWGMSWPVWAVSHGQNPLLSTYLNAPAGFNVMWTYPPLPGLVMAPVTLVAGPVFSYNLLITLGMAVSGWLMSLATHRFVADWRAAFIAGLLFAFGPYTAAHALGHVVLAVQPAAPLLLLLGHEVVVRQRWGMRRSGAALGVVAALQLVTFVETLALLAVVSVVAAIAALLVRDPGWRGRLAHLRGALVFACLVAAALSAYPLAIMLFGPQHLGGGAVHGSGDIVANLANFVVPSPTQLLAASHALDVTQGPGVDGNPAEWTAYLGIPLLVVIAVVVARCWATQRLVRFLSIVGGVVVVLSLGQRLWLTADVQTHVALPAAIFDHVPLLQNIVWSRLAVVVDMVAALLVAVYLVRSRSASPLLRRRYHVPLMAALALSLLPVIPYPTVAAPVVPAFFTSAEVNRIAPGSTALVAPYPHDGLVIEPEDWQLAAGFRFRMVGGYMFVPGPNGPDLSQPTPLTTAMRAIADGARGAGLSPAERTAMLTEVKQDHIGTVIVGPMSHRDVMVSFMTDLLGHAPEADQGVDVWWGVS